MHKIIGTANASWIYVPECLTYDVFVLPYVGEDEFCANQNNFCLDVYELMDACIENVGS